MQAIIESKATGIFIDKKNPKNPFLNELSMLQNLINNGFRVKFGYIVLAEQISSRSHRLLDEANSYINEYVDKNDKDFGVYCFSKIDSKDEYPLYNGNPYFFEDYIRHLCS